MKDKILNSCINFLKKYNNYSKKDLLKLRYGLEGIYLTITKLVIILLLALILGIFKEVILVIIFFNILRFFGFGFHAEKSSQCLVFSILTFIFIPFLLLKINIPFFAYLIFSLLCVLTYFIFAPADTVKRPLINNRKRLIRKLLTVLVGCIYIFLMIYFKNYIFSKVLLSSLIIESIFINPLTYKIYNQPYNNYKNLNSA